MAVKNVQHSAWHKRKHKHALLTYSRIFGSIFRKISAGPLRSNAHIRPYGKACCAWYGINSGSQRSKQLRSTYKLVLIAETTEKTLGLPLQWDILNSFCTLEHLGRHPNLQTLVKIHHIHACSARLPTVACWISCITFSSIWGKKTLTAKSSKKLPNPSSLWSSLHNLL